MVLICVYLDHLKPIKGSGKIAFTLGFPHMLGLTAFKQSASFGDLRVFEDSNEKFIEESSNKVKHCVKYSWIIH